MSTSSTIRIGLIGAGANTRSRHIPGFQAIPGVEVVAVANRSRESGERVAQQLDIPRVYDTWQELVADNGIDAVMIGTWPYLHCPVTLAALAAGKHVLTEARLARNLAEAEAMLAACRAHPQLVTQVVPAPFTFAADRAIQQRITDGYLGELLSVAIRAADMRPGGTFVNRDGPLTWRQNRELSGFNVMSMGIWYECALRWTPGVNSVMARTRTFTPMRRDGETGEPKAATVPDHVAVIGDMPGGGVFQMQVTGVSGLVGAPEATLYGSEGTLRFQQAGAKLWGGRRGDTQLAEIEISEGERYGWRVEAEFIGAIRGEEQITRTSFADGVRYMAFTEAVARSAAEGRAVPVLY